MFYFLSLIWNLNSALNSVNFDFFDQLKFIRLTERCSNDFTKFVRIFTNFTNIFFWKVNVCDDRIVAKRELEVIEGSEEPSKEENDKIMKMYCRGLSYHTGSASGQKARQLIFISVSYFFFWGLFRFYDNRNENLLVLKQKNE